MLVFEGVTKSFGRVRAVDGLSFAIEPGEVFGLLGPNGAGKTTSISLAVGLLRPDAGLDPLGHRRAPRAGGPRGPWASRPRASRCTTT
jgi:ABC-type multidrug transport system ATPase subunit